VIYNVKQLEGSRFGIAYEHKRAAMDALVASIKNAARYDAGKIQYLVEQPTLQDMLDSLGWRSVLGRDDGIVGLWWGSDRWGGDDHDRDSTGEDHLIALAPHVQPGSLLHLQGTTHAGRWVEWKWVFTNGGLVRQKPLVTWPLEDSAAVEDERIAVLAPRQA
jgi:hypothetical protein